MAHQVPLVNPVSVKVIVYVTFANVIVSETDAPLTVKLPDDGDGLSILYPVWTVNEYVPFGSVNEIVVVLYGSENPCEVVLTLTYHVPLVNPLSVKVIVYVTSVNVIEIETLAPLIVMLPAPGEGL